MSEHLPVLADKDFCLIVLQQCGTSSLQFNDLQCGWWILSGKIRRIFHNLSLHTICVGKYIVCRENGWIWRHLTIGKYVEGSITYIKAVLHKGYLLSAQGRRIWDFRTYFLPNFYNFFIKMAQSTVFSHLSFFLYQKAPFY